ncbi:thermonuclease family protein [Roseobacter litoralis]|uniref:thermonuclease family protein n=1 Tax=Roseobacter litoralis TaxID=42443 RepID=UPI00031A0FE1|nr:thermonuclease family protein [Roseobacter litoralis]
MQEQNNKPLAYVPRAENPICAVIRVVDGDTIDVACRDGRANVRLTGYDKPETFRPGCALEKQMGTRAAQHLEDRLRGATLVGLSPEGIDKYRRPLANAVIDGVPVSEIMVKAGLAVRYDGGKRINWCERLKA